MTDLSTSCCTRPVAFRIASSAPSSERAPIAITTAVAPGESWFRDFGDRDAAAVAVWYVACWFAGYERRAQPRRRRLCFHPQGARGHVSRDRSGESSAIPDPSLHLGADLIIVGSKGLTGVERLVLGSVAEQVVREAGCTVEVARPKTYEHVDLLEIANAEHHHQRYTPPHRYTYSSSCVDLRPNEWPLY